MDKDGSLMLPHATRGAVVSRELSPVCPHREPVYNLFAVVAQFSDKCPLLPLSGVSLLVLNPEKELSFTDAEAWVKD